MVVYKKNSIYNLTNRGEGLFYPELKCSFRGAIGHKAVAPVQDGNRHLVVSSDNIYIYDGFGFKYPPIGDKIKNFFFNKLDFTRKEDVYVKALPQRYECWIFFDNKETGNREALCWNWQRDSWTHHDIPVRSMVNANDLISNPDNAVLIGVGGAHTKNDNDGKRGLATAFQGNNDAGTAIEAIVRYPIQALIGRDGEYKDHSWVNFVELNAVPVPNTSNIIPANTEIFDSIATVADPLIKRDAGVYELKIIYSDSSVRNVMSEGPFAGRTFYTAEEWGIDKPWCINEECTYGMMVYTCLMSTYIRSSEKSLIPPNS